MRRRIGGGLITSILLATFLAGAAVFVYLSPLFEREAPRAAIPGRIYWNFKTPLTIKISDNEGLSNYKVTILERGKKVVLSEGVLPEGTKEATLTLTYPPKAFLPQTKDAKITIELADRSLWNFFSPNRSKIEAPVVCDLTPPYVENIASSYSIGRGGSAAVVFGARDENLREVYILTNSGKRFFVQPFVKNGFYATLIAWPLTDKSFDAWIVATDKAGNQTTQRLPFFHKGVNYKTTKIELKGDFLNAKINELSSSMKGAVNAAPLDRFLFVNNTLRAENEKLISKITTRIGTNLVDSFFTEPFVPIKNASVVGSFGDHRSYYLNGKVISESYHKGIDFASVKEDTIVAPNNGVVIYEAPNGIYGNMSILYHGMGLFTLYAHCSSFLAKVGDIVQRGTPIAKTGTSGLAFGDHLHFGILIQGVEVQPLEWLDANWIRLNVTNVLAQAKEIITSKKW